MNMRTVSKFLESAEGLLSDISSQRALNQWSKVCQTLRKFDNMNAADFCDLLVKAEEFQRTGVLSPSRRTQSSVVDPTKVKHLAQQILELQERALDRSVNYDFIESEVDLLLKPRSVSRDETIAVAKEVNIQKKISTKKNAVFEIKKRLTREKEALQRASF